MNIHRIEWFYSNDVYTNIVDNSLVQAALVSSDQIASLGSAERAVIAKDEFWNNAATQVGFATRNFPHVTDWSQLPMGGLLVPPKPLFLGIDSVLLAAAAQVYIRIFFTIVQLKDADYFELLETFRFYG
jgi:hypothetical protein